MAYATTTSSHTFRIPFWRIYLPAVMYAQALFAPLMWGMFYLTIGGFGGLGRQQVVLYGLGAAAVAGLLVPTFLIYVFVLKVRVTPDGLTCSNGMGGIKTVPWESITGVKRLILPGFPYLVVSSTKIRLKLWLPLFLGRMEEFSDKVEEYAGGDHPLYRALPIQDG